tara:strand:+ start:54 stop:365 length:312 start_codon:yes stop_codon:yes gene_type:complete
MSDEFAMIRYELQDGDRTHYDQLIVHIDVSRSTDLELIHRMYGLDAFDEDSSEWHNMAEERVLLAEEYEKNGCIETSWGFVKVIDKKPMTRETKELFNSYGVC